MCGLLAAHILAVSDESMLGVAIERDRQPHLPGLLHTRIMAATPRSLKCLLHRD